MSQAINEHTMKRIRTGVNSEEYRNNPFWDKVERDKKAEKEKQQEKEGGKKEPGA